MANLTELLEKIFTLTSNVDNLVKDVDRLNQLLLDHHERIVRLESRDELLVEKAKNASLSAVLQTNHALLEKMAAIENEFRSTSLPGRLTQPTVRGDGASVDMMPSQAPS
jgi:hypothetical protein